MYVQESIDSHYITKGPSIRDVRKILPSPPPPTLHVRKIWPFTGKINTWIKVNQNLIIIILNTFNFNKYCVITGSRLYININLKQHKSEKNESSRGGEVIFSEPIKGPSTKDVRQMGRGVVLKFRTFPDGGPEGGGLWKFGRPKISEKIELPKFLRAR